MTQPTTGHYTSLTPEWANKDVQARFNDVVRSVGSEEGAVVFDLVKYLEENVVDWERHMNVFYDGIHITDVGSRIYGDFITQSLIPIVKGVCETDYPAQKPVHELGGLPNVRR
jgi:hypothetical protein